MHIYDGDMDRAISFMVSRSVETISNLSNSGKEKIHPSWKILPRTMWTAFHYLSALKNGVEIKKSPMDSSRKFL